MNRLKSSLLFFAFALILCLPAHAVLDQENERQPNFVSIHPTGDEIWQQQVIVGIAGKLDAIEVFYKNDAPWLGDALAFEFFVNRGVGWQSDANEFVTTVITHVANVWIDVSRANLTFQTGDQFVFGVSRASGGTLCCYLLGTGNTYSGDLWSHYSNSVHLLQQDFAFRTYVSAIPEVGTGHFLLIGLVVGVGARSLRAHGASHSAV